jgi:uncharacterized membrane protein
MLQKEMTMTLVPLMNASLLILIHTVVAILVLVIGAAQLSLAKGTPWHRQLGYAWVCLMVFVAISGFFIFDTQVVLPFSLLSNLLSALLLVLLWRGIRLARTGKIKAHRQTMILLFWGTVFVGLLTIAPGRIMHQVQTGL